MSDITLSVLDEALKIDITITKYIGDTVVGMICSCHPAYQANMMLFSAGTDFPDTYTNHSDTAVFINCIYIQYKK
eukprot:14874503-Ditylum_brightwellii.AAC.1